MSLSDQMSEYRARQARLYKERTQGAVSFSEPSLVGGLPPTQADHGQHLANHQSLRHQPSKEFFLKNRSPLCPMLGELGVPKYVTAFLLARKSELLLAEIHGDRRPLKLKRPAETSISVCSWNIDGLEDHKSDDPKVTVSHLIQRTVGACEVLLKTLPDVICLQEVLEDTFELFSKLLAPFYEFVKPLNRHAYFVAMGYRIATLKLEDTNMYGFQTTQMGRQLIAQTFTLKNRTDSPSLIVGTTHLESCKPAATTRMAQLNECFQFLADLPGESRVLCGDLNLRDPEIKSFVGNFESGTHYADVFRVMDSPKEHQFTWDLTRNTNLQGSMRFRFDRMFYESAYTENSKLGPLQKSKKKRKIHGHGNWGPTSFQLLGTSPLLDYERFVSDHFGIFAVFTHE